jgi:hypothetical protein
MPRVSCSYAKPWSRPAKKPRLHAFERLFREGSRAQRGEHGCAHMAIGAQDRREVLDYENSALADLA